MNYENILYRCLKELNIDSENYTKKEFQKLRLKMLDRIIYIKNKINLTIKNADTTPLKEDLIVYYSCFLWCMSIGNNKSAHFYSTLKNTVKNFISLYSKQ